MQFRLRLQVSGAAANAKRIVQFEQPPASVPGLACLACLPAWPAVDGIYMLYSSGNAERCRAAATQDAG